MRSAQAMLIVSVLALAGSRPASSQVTTATFYGIIHDQSGAVVPSAVVTITNEETGVSRSQITSATGEFAFQFVPVGPYTVRIAAEGFKLHQVRGTELRAAQQTRQVFTLELGNVAERVNVTAEAPLVNSVTAEQRESISTQEVRELPVGRRTLSNVFSLGTGIAPTGTGQFTLNGLGQAATSFTMDGIDASSNPQAPQAQFNGGFNYISTVSMEAVQEVQVSKGVFSAEYGRTLGGNVNVITKSGSNTWHGSLFHLFNSEELNAREQFLTSKPAVTFNQYGGSVGGPIVRDKAFFFTAIEGYEERSATTVQGNVPTERLRADMLRAVPDYKLILDAFPLPNQPHAATADTGAYIAAGSISAKDLHAVVRPDVWLFGGKLLLTGTYVRSRPDRVEPRYQPVNSRVFKGKTERVNVTGTLLGGSNWTSESRYGYNRNDRNRIDGFWDLVDPNTSESQPGGRRVPGINALGFSIGGELNIIGRAPHQSFDQKFAVNSGRHSLKFGALFFRREIGSENIENPVFQYQNRADLVANVPSLAQFTFGRADFDAAATEWGLFFQDDFRVSPKLTLNLGLRYDYFSPFTAHRAGQPGEPPYLFNFSSFSLPDFRPGPFRPFDSPYDTDKLNLGPRFGFAYNPDGRAKTVIRGGFAVLFTPVNGEIVKNMAQNSATEPFRARFSKSEAQNLNLVFPTYNEDALRLLTGGEAAPAFQYLDPHLDSPYSMNFSLTVERALTSSLALETAFVGTRGVKFQTMRFYNEIDRLTGQRPNPDLGSDRYYDGSESTRYYSWQNSLRKRFSRGLTANLHYTWGKAIAYARGDLGFGNASIQDFFDIRSNRGPSEFDITHRVTGDFLYEVPGFRGASAFARNVLGGWQISGLITAQTGLPLNITQPSAIQGQRPDVIGANVIDSDYRSSLIYLNRAAFAPVPESSTTGASLRPGTLGNGAVRGPGLWNLDLGLAKNFSITEDARLQLRGEFLNALNHTNFTTVDTNIESGRFGRLTGTNGARRVQLALRFRF